MMKYDYIFVDLDGPILDGRYRHYNCYKDILKKYGGCLVGLEQYWEMKRDRVSRKYLLEISQFGGTYDQYMKEWLKRIELREYLEYDLLQENAVLALQKLRNMTSNLFLVTMRENYDNLIWQLNKLNIYDLFNRVICGGSNEVAAKYELIKEFVFNNAIFIGDTEVDIQAAQLSGCEFIGILNGLRSKETFQNYLTYNDIYSLAQNIER